MSMSPPFLIAVVAAAASFALPADIAAASQSDDNSAKTVLENDSRLRRACFENARNGRTGLKALEPCDRALQNDTLSPRKRAVAHANRGVIQFNIGDFDAAVADFTMSLDLGIHVKAKIYANRGLSYEALHYDALARADYQAVLAITDRHPFAARRLEELSKPLYQRSTIPRRITAEIPQAASPGM